MKSSPTRWHILSKQKTKKLSQENIINTLLKNRGLISKKEKEEFFKPSQPKDISVKSLGIKESEVKKATERIKKAAKKGETIIIYGDYDVDGISGSGILFETLYRLTKNVHPHLPDRFTEGYGLNPESIEKLKKDHSDLGVIISVDNGISAYAGVEKANELGIDVIITDHHRRGKKDPKAFAILYTDKISGAGVAWFLARELRKRLTLPLPSWGDGMDLAALGTIADMVSLIGPNRSLAYHGLAALGKTSRPGLLALFEEARVDPSIIDAYSVGHLIAPRLNAAGRLETALDSLRLLCTLKKDRARELAHHLGVTNLRRQKIQEEIILSARQLVLKLPERKVLVVADENYHEGVIGLAASRLAEEFHRPSIVISKGKKAKGSARSIPGFDIIAAIEKLGDILISAGGHSMAAGFVIETKNIKIFTERLEEVSQAALTDEILERKLKLDMEIAFSDITFKLLKKIQEFDPTGVGNPGPGFVTRKVEVLDSRVVGGDGAHLKLVLAKDGITFDAIAFRQAVLYKSLSPAQTVDIAYSISEDTWNGGEKIQLKIKDIKI